MKCLSILMAALTSVVPAIAGAATPDGMSPVAGPSCVAAACLITSMSVQPVALTVANLESGAAAQTGVVAVATSGGGQGTTGAAGVSASGITGGSGAAAPGTGGGTTPGASSGGGSPGGAISGGGGTGPGGAMSQPTPPGGDNRNLSNRRIDRGQGGAPNSARPPVSESDAARRVQQSTGGRILDVKPDNAQGRLTYRVKVLNDAGEVRIITIDAQTGTRE
jgi:hypothetical protein